MGYARSVASTNANGVGLHACQMRQPSFVVICSCTYAFKTHSRLMGAHGLAARFVYVFRGETEKTQARPPPRLPVTGPEKRITPAGKKGEIWAFSCHRLRAFRVADRAETRLPDALNWRRAKG